MRFLLITVGTDGDVFPYVGLGARLRDRGHQVTLVASEHYAPLAHAHGLEFAALVSTDENHQLFSHPDFWNPWKTAALSGRWGRQHLARQYQLLARLARAGTDSGASPGADDKPILVANPGVLAAGLVHESLGCPWISLVLQPWMIPSAVAPPIMPRLEFLRRMPRWCWPIFWPMFWRGLDVMVHVLIGRHLNPLRTALGLPPTRRIVQSWLSPQLAIGLFPDWYGPPQADWPGQLQLTGFPLVDGGGDDRLPEDVRQFIANGEPPVAFTFGTGMAHPARHFRAALEACSTLGVRGIFLTRYHDQLPRPLPASVLACSYAPFRTLFPRCTAVVHHGGIGTVAQAMAAGTPQLISPICFDQADNGDRVRGLGVGAVLSNRRGQHGAAIAAALRRLLTRDVQERCRILASRLRGVDALGVTADAVEHAARASRSPH